MGTPPLHPPQRVQPMQQRTVVPKNEQSVRLILRQQPQILIRNPVNPDENAANLVVCRAAGPRKIGKSPRQLIGSLEVDPQLLHVGHVALQKAPQIHQLLVLDGRRAHARLARELLVQQRHVGLAHHAGDVVA